MTGEQRLTIAFELHEMSCEIARESIRRQHSEADATEVERLLRHRLELSRAAQTSEDILWIAFVGRTREAR